MTKRGDHTKSLTEVYLFRNNNLCKEVIQGHHRGDPEVFNVFQARDPWADSDTVTDPLFHIDLLHHHKLMNIVW